MVRLSSISLSWLTVERQRGDELDGGATSPIIDPVFYVNMQRSRQSPRDIMVYLDQAGVAQSSVFRGDINASLPGPGADPLGAAVDKIPPMISWPHASARADLRPPRSAAAAHGATIKRTATRKLRTIRYAREQLHIQNLLIMVFWIHLRESKSES